MFRLVFVFVDPVVCRSVRDFRLPGIFLWFLARRKRFRRKKKKKGGARSDGVRLWFTCAGQSRCGAEVVLRKGGTSGKTRSDGGGIEWVTMTADSAARVER